MAMRLRPILMLLRVEQWLKNGFVLVGLLFGHGWDDAGMVAAAWAAAAAFCLLSSATYVFNDLMDRDQDRLHPRKRNRPIASGAVGTATAVTVGLACLLAGLIIAASSTQALWVFAAYLGLNIAYSLGMKTVPVLDAFIIAAGFMLRILAGTVGIGIAPSHWLLLTGLMLTLFLAFAKRRAELLELADAGPVHRPVLARYSTAMLDQFIGITATASLIGYSLYTVSAETVALHGDARLMVTVPIACYGILRYVFLLHGGAGGDPVQEVLRDRQLMLTVMGWLVTVWVLID
mgnify:CR=1 FL=1